MGLYNFSPFFALTYPSDRRLVLERKLLRVVWVKGLRETFRPVECRGLRKGFIVKRVIEYPYKITSTSDMWLQTIN